MMTKNEAAAVRMVTMLMNFSNSLFATKVSTVLTVVTVMAIHGVAYAFVATTWLAPFLQGLMK